MTLPNFALKNEIDMMFVNTFTPRNPDDGMCVRVFSSFWGLYVASVIGDVTLLLSEVEVRGELNVHMCECGGVCECICA